MAAWFSVELEDDVELAAVFELFAKVGSEFVVLVVLAIWRARLVLGLRNTREQVAAKDRWSEREAQQQCERQQTSFSNRRFQLVSSVPEGFEPSARQKLAKSHVQRPCQICFNGLYSCG